MARSTTAFRFFLREPLSLEHRAALGAVPGLVVKDKLVVAPLNAAWLAEKALQSFALPFIVNAPDGQERHNLSTLRALCANAPIRDWVFDYMAPFQRQGVVRALNAPRENYIFGWPTGAGKTLGGIVWSLVRAGNVIFITKAAARRTIQIEVERYTTVKPAVLWPPSDRRYDEDVVASIHEQRIVIAGWDSIPAMMDTLLSVNATSIVFDELHRGKGHQRWQAIPDRDENGNDVKRFKRLENIVSCAARLSANIPRRLGMTATIIPDRIRDLWGQLDLVFPGQWGSYWGKMIGEGDEQVRVNSFVKRYCDLAMSNWGAWDDQGESNLDELRDRMKFAVHEVDSKITHANLPPKRRQNVYLSKADQNAPSSFAEELKKAQRSGAKSLREVRLAEAASRKRTYVVDEVVEAVKTGEKVVIFTGRHKDCDRLSEAISKAIDRLHLTVPIFVAHGGSGTAVRDEIQAQWMGNITNPDAPPPLTGPAILIGTYQAWGESYSLHDTDLLLVVQLPINAKELWQTEGRVYRQGQRRPVLIKYIVAEGTYDEAVASILLSKLPAVADVQSESQFKEALDQFIGRDDASAIEKKLLAVVNHDPDELWKEFELEGT